MIRKKKGITHCSNIVCRLGRSHRLRIFEICELDLLVEKEDVPRADVSVDPPELVKGAEG